MPSYTKLFNSIVTSTIWTEDDKTRIMWITMLAMADQHGEVNGSVPGMARLAGMTLECAQMAISKLMSPDKYSRTPDFEGRRIIEIPGGWELINHKKYRAMASKEDSKAATAQRVKRFRERNANVTVCNANVTHSNATVTEGRDIAEAEAEADTEELETPNPFKKGNGDCFQLVEEVEKPNEEAVNAKRKRRTKEQITAQEGIAVEIFSLYPNKSSPNDAYKAIRNAIAKHGEEYIMERVKAYSTAVRSLGTLSTEQERFIPHCSTWMKKGKYQETEKEWLLYLRPQTLPHQKGCYTGKTQEEEEANLAACGGKF